MPELKLVITAEDAKAITALRRAVAEQKKLQQEADRANSASAKGSEKAAGATDKATEAVRRTGKAFGDAGKAASGAFGASAVAQLKSYATGFIGVTAAVAGLKTVIREVGKVLEENKAKVDENIGAIARFAALGSMSKKDREFIFKNAGNLEPAQALEIGFKARSAGMTDAQTKELFKEAGQAKTLGEDPVKFANSIKSLKKGGLAGKSLTQISSFLTRMAEQSPLAADVYAEELTKDVALAAATDREKAAVGAGITGIMQAMGVDAEPQMATTAMKGFLTKRTTGKGAEYMRAQGLQGKDIVEQLQGLSAIAQAEDFSKEYVTGQKTTTREEEFFGAFGRESGLKLLRRLGTGGGVARASRDEELLAQMRTGKGKEFMKGAGLEGTPEEQLAGLAGMAQGADWQKEIKVGGKTTSKEGQFYEAFGIRTGPYLAALLKSKPAMAQVPGDVAAGVAALGETGPSLAERKVATMKKQDPQFAAVAERRKMETKRTEWRPLERGFEQSGLMLQKEKAQTYLAEQGFGSQLLGFLRELVTPVGARAGMIGGKAGASAAERAGAAIDELVTRENTDATERLTKAIKALVDVVGPRGAAPVSAMQRNAGIGG